MWQPASRKMPAASAGITSFFIMFIIFLLNLFCRRDSKRRTLPLPAERRWMQNRTIGDALSKLPTCSIVLPVLDARKGYLQSRLDKIATQTHPILVVNHAQMQARHLIISY